MCCDRLIDIAAELELSPELVRQQTRIGLAGRLPGLRDPLRSPQRERPLRGDIFGTSDDFGEEALIGQGVEHQAAILRFLRRHGPGGAQHLYRA